MVFEVLGERLCGLLIGGISSGPGVLAPGAAVSVVMDEVTSISV